MRRHPPDLLSITDLPSWDETEPLLACLSTKNGAVPPNGNFLGAIDAIGAICNSDGMFRQ